MGDEALKRRIQQAAPMARKICRAMQEQVTGMGFGDDEVVLGDPEQATHWSSLESVNWVLSDLDSCFQRADNEA